jgi:hypothetical protein
MTNLLAGAGPVSFSPLSPVKSVPLFAWPASPNRQTASLTASMLSQHNQLHQLHAHNQNKSQAQFSDLHSSGYHSFMTESILDKSKNLSAGISAHSSPDNSMSFRNIPSIQFPDRAAMNQSLNESLMFNFDPRIIAGYRAMSISPQQGEVRVPTPVWKGAHGIGGASLNRTSPTPLESGNW